MVLSRALLIISPHRCVKSHERNINGINKLSGLTRMTVKKGKVSERYFPPARKRSGFLLRALSTLPHKLIILSPSLLSRRNDNEIVTFEAPCGSRPARLAPLAPFSFSSRRLFVSIAVRIDSPAIPPVSNRRFTIIRSSIAYVYE